MYNSSKMIANILSILFLLILSSFSGVQNVKLDSILADCTKQNLESCVLSKQKDFIPLIVKEHNLQSYFIDKVVVQNPEIKMVITNSTFNGVDGINILNYKYNGTHINMIASYKKMALHAFGNCDVQGRIAAFNINGKGKIDVNIIGLQASINFELAKKKSQVKARRISATYDVEKLETRLINVFKSKQIEKSLNYVLIENWQETNELFREEGAKIVIRVSNIYNSEILHGLPIEIFH